jgi:hypothetical protein
VTCPPKHNQGLHAQRGLTRRSSLNGYKSCGGHVSSTKRLAPAFRSRTILRTRSISAVRSPCVVLAFRGRSSPSGVRGPVCYALRAVCTAQRASLAPGWASRAASERNYAMMRIMETTKQKAMIAGFTSSERDYIRRELDQFFSTLPSVADGFQIKTWRTGPLAGKPKLPLPAEGLLERGLMRLDTTGHWPRLFFTATGLTALRMMMRDRRLVDPVKFAHVRQELGIDPIPEKTGAPQL